MNNFKFGTRIGAGFCAMMLIALSLGAFAYAQIGIINKRATSITADSLPGVYDIGRLKYQTINRYCLLLKHINTSDKAEGAWR